MDAAAALQPGIDVRMAARQQANQRAGITVATAAGNNQLVVGQSFTPEPLL